MSAKQKEVQKWLLEQFGEADIPTFEKTEENVDILYHLMKSHTQAKQDVESVDRFMESRAQNYYNLTRHTSKLLQDINMTPSSLTGDEKKCFDALVNICSELDLESPELSNIVLGISNLEDQSLTVNSALEKGKQQTAQLFKLSQDTAQKLEDIKSVSYNADIWQREQLEAVAKEEKKRDFSEKKSQQYTSEIKHLEEKLARTGFSTENTHDAMLKKMEEMEALEKEYLEAKSTLDSYVLPHDMLLAKLKVEEAKQELAALMK